MALSNSCHYGWLQIWSRCLVLCSSSSTFSSCRFLSQTLLDRYSSRFPRSSFPGNELIVLVSILGSFMGILQLCIWVVDVSSTTSILESFMLNKSVAGILPWTMLTGNKLAGPERQAGWVNYSSTIHHTYRCPTCLTNS
jgi:hypothetical protein